MERRRRPHALGRGDAAGAPPHARAALRRAHDERQDRERAREPRRQLHDGLGREHEARGARGQGLRVRRGRHGHRRGDRLRRRALRAPAVRHRRAADPRDGARALEERDRRPHARVRPRRPRGHAAGRRGRAQAPRGGHRRHRAPRLPARGGGRRGRQAHGRGGRLKEVPAGAGGLRLPPVALPAPGRHRRAAGAHARGDGALRRPRLRRRRPRGHARRPASSDARGARAVRRSALYHGRRTRAARHELRAPRATESAN